MSRTPRKATAPNTAQSKSSAPTRAAVAPPAPAAPRPRKGPLTRLSTAINEQVSRQANARSGKAKPATRRGKKGLVLYVEPAVTVAIRKLALDTGLSVQQLGMEALNMLFEKHRYPVFPVSSET